MADVSLHLLTQLLDAAVEGIFAFDRNSRFTVWNKGMEEITGLPRTNVIGCNALELFPSLIKTGEDSFFHGALTGERAICRKSSLSSGASAQSETHYYPLFDKGDEIVGGMGIVRPASCKHADPETGSAYQRLTSHLENSPLAVVEWDSDFRVSRWSESAEVLFGWKAEEVLGKHVDEWKFVFPEDLNAVESVTFRQRQGVEVQGVLSNRNYRKDGSVIHCEWYNSVLHDDFGKLVSVLSLVLNITRSGTRKEELLVPPDQLKKMYILPRILNPMGTMDAIDFLLDKLRNTKSNADFFESMNA